MFKRAGVQVNKRQLANWILSTGYWILFTAYCLLLPGCQTAVSPPPPTPILPSPLVPTLVAPSSPAATPTPPLDTGWQPLRPGMERRTITLLNPTGQSTEQLYLLRLEPAQFQFSIGYRPGQPQSLADWQQETGALVVVNGGYFTPEFTATGLTVVDGQPSGVSYEGFGGMFSVTRDVTQEGVEVRGLEERPYSPTEPLLFALQSFPMLVKPGGQVGYPEEDGLPSRRTVVGQDQNGRILFILAPWGSFTLHKLSLFLANADLELETALNLDGGTSTGLLLADPPEQVPAFAALPTVILVNGR